MGEDMSKSPLILAIDQGTTSSRAIVFDEKAQIVAVAQQEFPQHYPTPGWVEHDPEDIWATTLTTAKKAFDEAEAGGGEVAAIGITNQRETTVIWDRKTLAPAHNAIVWQDRRTSEFCAQLKSDGAEAEISEKTGLLLDPYFSASKIRWLLKNIEGLAASAKNGAVAAGTIDSFLIAKLTGGAHATDATNASRTSLFNIRRNEWDADLLEMFDVPATILPEVKDSNGDFGRTEPALFGRSLPIFGAVGDQQSAALGQACLSPGDIKSTYGTGCFVLVNTGDAIVSSSNRLLSTIASRIDGKLQYALEGSIFVAGAAVQWLRDELHIIESATETEALAAGIADTGGVYFVPAFTGLGAPHWAADARGALYGLTRGSGRAEIVRAALEAVAYQTADLIDAVAADGVECKTLKVDGGMAANNWLMQFLADIQNAPVERPVIMETTALGAAFLAGAKSGVYGSLEQTASLRSIDAVFSPAMSAETRQGLRQGWGKAVSRTLH